MTKFKTSLQTIFYSAVVIASVIALGYTVQLYAERRIDGLQFLLTAEMSTFGALVCTMLSMNGPDEPPPSIIETPKARHPKSQLRPALARWFSGVGDAA